MAFTGYVDEISRARVKGWAVDKGRPDGPISISIHVNGAHRGVCLASLERNDIVAPAGEQPDRHYGFEFAFEPPLSPFLEITVEVKETWTAAPLRNGTRVLPRPKILGGQTGRVPILVTSTGRSGTTLIMSELAAHPDIVVGDRYPYEIKQIAYHAAAFRTLVADADRIRSTDPETMLAPARRYAIGGNPYHEAGYFDLGTSGECLREYWESTVPSEYATLFRRLILGYYDTLAAGQGKQSAEYFCEKGDVDEEVGLSARLFFDRVKEIVIVRDPRDLLCSAMSFWKLPPGEAIPMLQTTFPRLTRIARRAGPDTLVVRYEDLLRDPVPTRRAMSEFLGLDIVAPRAAGGEGIVSEHRTSRDPSASIGRWRNDLPSDLIASCEAALAPYFQDFDYELSDPALRRMRKGTDWPGEADRTRIAAEGQLAVSAFFDNHLSRDDDEPAVSTVLELTFGQTGGGGVFTLTGWSDPERNYVWTNGRESQLRLPAIPGQGDFRLLIAGRPFTRGDKLPRQNIGVLLDGQDMGSVEVGETCVIEVPVPSALTGSDHAITLTLCLPLAAKPRDIFGDPDDRILGLSLQSLLVVRVRDAGYSATQRVARPAMFIQGDDETLDIPVLDKIHGPHTFRALEILRGVFGQPLLDYLPHETLRAIHGYDSTRFIRLMLALESEFGRDLSEDDIDNVVTMGDVATLLRTKLSESV